MASSTAKPKNAQPVEPATSASGDAVLYSKLDPREWILKRPDTMIGSIEPETRVMWVSGASDSMVTPNMVQREVVVNPGILKLIDEIITNESDHAIRQAGSADKAGQVKNIKVTVDKATGAISVFNDGSGISSAMHPEHGVHTPELIFGNLFSGSNFDDTKERIVGGRNGVGSKGTNIFSKVFCLETVDAPEKKLYKQAWSNNMSEVSKPEITKYSKAPYTKFTFLLDYERFGATGLSDDMYAVIVRRVYDLCAIDLGVNVYLNDEKIMCKGFAAYAEAFLAQSAHTTRESLNVEGWNIVVALNSGDRFDQISFVNGVCTSRGGTHVELVTKQVVEGVVAAAAKKKITVRPIDVRSMLMVFINSSVPSPAFDGQTKEKLTTPASKFAKKYEIPDSFISKLLTTEFIELLTAASAVDSAKALKKADGKKSRRVFVNKLEDANKAGGPESHSCTLILTEGDSAATTAISGLSVVGRDYYGVFPLKGKIQNIHGLTASKASENAEIANIVKIMGMRYNKVYDDESVKELRYRKVMLMTDADADGSHIKGLFFNLINILWPSLLQLDGFVVSMLTPIVKARSADTTLSFYVMREFTEWQAQQNAAPKPGKWQIKYYKGLGTSDGQEAREYFRELKLVKYVYADLSKEVLDMAFNKKRPDDRKKWLDAFDPALVSDDLPRAPLVPYEVFVNNELIMFSMADNLRSIPSMVDGQKPGQRKILWCCRNRRLTEDVKVAQLAGHVSEKAAYHHGEVSLQQTIVKMAQDFVGAGNINLLLPKGQFGTRLQGGEDMASPRYIFTRLNPVTELLFSQYDDCILNYLSDDNMLVEPDYFIPIIPLVLVNGSSGIGTGYSSDLPCYNPSDIIAYLLSHISSVEGGVPPAKITISPWYAGFRGKITKVGVTYVSHGVWKATGPDTLEITELPIGVWTNEYKAMLDGLVENNTLKDFENQSSDVDVRFILRFPAKTLEGLCEEAGKLETMLKLKSTKGLSMTHIHLFNARGQIRKYANVQEIVDEFFEVRWEAYVKRKAAMIAALTEKANIAENRARFIEEVIAGEIKLLGVKSAALISALASRKFMKNLDNYSYLTELPVSSLTDEKRERLVAEAALKRKELADLEGKTIGQLWTEDLNALASAIEQSVATQVQPVAAPKVTKKRSAKK